MASADFSRQILFQPSFPVREISPGKNAVFPSMYLPHLRRLLLMQLLDFSLVCSLVHRLRLM